MNTLYKSQQGLRVDGNRQLPLLLLAIRGFGFYCASISLFRSHK